MQLNNLKMFGLNTTLMGVVKGVMEYYDIKMSNAMAFGGSGHAFLINIHEVLCPSGPYCWKYDRFFSSLANMGLDMKDLGFFLNDSTEDERKKVEQTIREHLDNGFPCSTLNMENQTIIGYEDDHFLLAQPWKLECEYTPPTVTFGTWDEFGKAIHANFFVFKKTRSKDEIQVIKESLRYAVELFRKPEQYNFEKYRIGPGAYDNWMKAVEQGHGGSHGNWWNGQVWSECRAMAAEYFTEIADRITGTNSMSCQELNTQYKDISGLLSQISNKDMDDVEKIKFIKEIKTREEDAIQLIEKFLKEL